MTEFNTGEVLHVQNLGPHVIRITLGGPGLAGFTSTGKDDEAVYLCFPLEGKDEPEYRWYTIREVVTEPEVRITIDVVLHDIGLATQWARSAMVGDRVTFSPPRGWHAPSAKVSDVLLIGDLTALPAIGRILGGLAPNVRARAVIEIPDQADRQELHSAANVEVTWIEHPKAGKAPSQIALLLRNTRLPAGQRYVWLAGEAAATREARKYLRHELGWPAQDYCIVGYWRLAKELWMERYESSQTDFEALWNQAEQRGLAEEEVLDIYEDALASEGL